MLEPISEDLRRLAAARETDVDAGASAFLFLAPLLYHRTIEWLTGETALHLSDDRLVEQWARQQEILLRSA